MHPCVIHLLGVVVFVEADVDSGDMFEGKVLQGPQVPHGPRLVGVQVN